MKFKLVLLALAIILLAGCSSIKQISFTYKVWTDNQLTMVCQPANDPHLTMSESPQRKDFLVEYDALSERNGALERRAYFLDANQERVAGGKKPRFVKPERSGTLRPVAIQNTGTWSTNSIPGPMPLVLYVNGSTLFQLVRDDQGLETFELPTYVEKNGTITRLALTPLAVGGDAAIAAFILGCSWMFGPPLYTY
jgi:hypothetical protein